MVVEGRVAKEDCVHVCGISLIALPGAEHCVLGRGFHQAEVFALEGIMGTMSGIYHISTRLGLLCLLF